MASLVKFNKLAGAKMRWRYMPKFPYGEGRPGTRQIDANFLKTLTRAFTDLWVLSGLGPADRIVSAGAWVPEGTNGRGPDDWHVRGIAIDIDAIHWEYTSFIAHPDHSEPDFYFGLEAHFRCYFHTVLGYSYNAEHMRHFHIQDDEPRPWQSQSKMHKKFLQSTMKDVWHVNGTPYYTGKIDGIWGKKSAAAWKRLSKFLGLELNIASDLKTWLRYLQLTAIQGMRLQ